MEVLFFFNTKVNTNFILYLIKIISTQFRYEIHSNVFKRPVCLAATNCHLEFSLFFIINKILCSITISKSALKFWYENIIKVFIPVIIYVSYIDLRDIWKNACWPVIDFVIKISFLGCNYLRSLELFWKSSVLRLLLKSLAITGDNSSPYFLISFAGIYVGWVVFQKF